MNSGRFPPEFFFIGDSAYNFGPSMQTPFPHRHLSNEKDVYNWQQSSLRMAIECAFGMLVRRWGVMWRPLEMAVDKRPLTVSCCMILQNFIIDYGQGRDGCFEDVDDDSFGFGVLARGRVPG